MDRKIIIWNGKLEITKHESGFIVSDASANFIFHVATMKLGTEEPTWLWLSSRNGIHIGSIWINTDTDIQKIKELLEETK